jgi:hypothetical protein
MSELELRFRLPLEGWPRALVETSYGFHGAVVRIDGREVLSAPDREALLRGVSGRVPGHAGELRLSLEVDADDRRELILEVNGVEALREDRLAARPSRSAWIHAWGALAASFFGFVASYLYLLRAQATGDPWPMKMGVHTAGWHLMLTLTLFPASVWGQRLGIRAVQLVSLVFFCIHVGMAIANTGGDDPEYGIWIALFNAASGLLFLFALVYGQVAHRDMDPSRALTELRPVPSDTESDAA